MKMDMNRQGEIARMLIKKLARDKGVRLTPNFKREVAAEAQAIGIDAKEAMQFAEIIVRELVDEAFPPNQP